MTPHSLARTALGILAAIFLSIWLAFGIVALFGAKEGHWIKRDASMPLYKLQHGEPLTESDKDAILERPRYVSPQEGKGASWSGFQCCSVVFALPGLMIVLYLFQTRQRPQTH